MYGLKKGVHYVVDRIPPDSFEIIGAPLKSYENTISFNNGGLIFLASLDNYKVIDGREFAWALLDETKDTREEAVKEVIITRLRQLGMMVGSNGKIYRTLKWHPDKQEMEDVLARKVASGEWIHTREGNKFHTKDGVELVGYTPIYIFTSPAKAKWIMEWFKLDEDAEEIERTIYTPGDYYRKRKGDQLVVIASTYHNELNLSPGFIQRTIDAQAGNKGKVRMLIYGSPFGKTGGEYYHAYDRIKHIKKFDIWEDEPVHVSFDFNVVPYMTATLWQMKFDTERKRYLIRAFDEFCLENPLNSTPALCRAIISKWDNLIKKTGFFYYGDYSGKARNTISEEFKNQYAVIEEFFKAYISNYSDMVRPNTLHVTRRDFCNKMLFGSFPIDIEIHERCVKLRGDLEFVKEDANGKKLKTKITVEGVSFEEHGHTSDTMDYFLCSAFENLVTS